MPWRITPATAVIIHPKLNGLRTPLLCLLLALFAPAIADAQCKTVTLKPGTKVPFRLKPKRDLTSSRLRIGDYVEFELLEDLKWQPDCADDKQVIISKTTPIIGQVLDRRNKFTIFRKAGFGVGKLKTAAIDGQSVDIDFRRPQLPRKKKKRSDERAEEKLCIDKTVDKEARGALIPCVKGRVYEAKFFSSLPSAALSVAAATTLVRIKDDAEGAVVGATLVEKIASQTGLSDILNGVDAEMSSGEIFDASFLVGAATLVIKLPGQEIKKDEQKVGRYTGIPVPPGFIVTNYFSDLVAYPAPPGVFFNGQVIERYTDKPVGAKMNVCEGQSVPSGWMLVDRKNDADVCPREPGDKSTGPTYSVMLKTQ